MSTLMTIPEVASELKVSRQTVYNLIRDGQLAAVKVRRAARVRREVLEKYLDRQTQRRKPR